MHAPATFELSMTDEEYGALAGLVEGQLGIRLPPEKRALVLRRLRDPIGLTGHPNYRSWADENLRGPVSPEVMSTLADALTTNHTHFWREPSHLEHLRDHALPDRIKVQQTSRDLRVWCAAAATGEEPYQLAMILRDLVGPTGWQAGVLATDVSARALQIARAGTYNAERLEGLLPAWRKRYVRMHADGSGTMNPALREDVTFRRLNLLSAAWPFRKPFDAIFCRNLLIYFDAANREAVIGRLVQWLQPGGYLYLGHAEGIPGHKWPLRHVAAGIYHKTGGRS